MLTALHVKDLDLPSAQFDQLLSTLPSLRRFDFNSCTLAPETLIEALTMHARQLRYLRARCGSSSTLNNSRTDKEWLSLMPNLVSASIETCYLADRPILIPATMRELDVRRCDDFHAGWRASMARAVRFAHEHLAVFSLLGHTNLTLKLRVWQWPPSTVQALMVCHLNLSSVCPF